MTTLISRATGNFTTSTTWSLCSTTGELDSEASSTTLDTTNQDSSTFVLEANQIDAVALKLASAAGSPSGTISVTLRNSTTASNVATVTINASDLSSGVGWHVFKFGSSHTPNGTDSYLIRVASSVAGNAFYTNGTSKNWTRQVRRTATQAPASGNKLMIAGEWTAAATSNSYTVTMNNTATTSFGVTAATAPQSITVNKNGTLSWSLGASSSYYLKWKGIFGVFGGGTLNIGGIGTPMPASSSAVLEMDSVSSGESGFVAYANSTVNVYGAEKTQFGFLMTGLSSGSTALGLDGEVEGWINGDEVCIAPTTTQRSECEKLTISSITDPATSFTTTSGTTATRTYSLPHIKAEVVNLSRNVKFRGINIQAQGYVLFKTTSTVNVEYAEFTLLGTNADGKRGVDATTSAAGSLSMQYCTFHCPITATEQTFGFVWTSSDGEIVFNNNSFFNIPVTAIYVASTNSSTDYTFSNNIVILTGQYGFQIEDCGGTYTNNRAIGAFNHGMWFSEEDYIGPLNISGNVCHSNRITGLYIACSDGEITECEISDLVIWRQDLGRGLDFDTGSIDVTMSDCTLFGNSGSSTSIRKSVGMLIDNIAITNDPSYSDAGGISFGSGCEVEIENSVIFGIIGVQSEAIAHVIIRNTDYSINDSDEFTIVVSSMTELNEYAMIAVQSYDLDPDVTKVTKGRCSIRSDSVLYNTAPPSIRLAFVNQITSPDVITSLGPRGGFLVPVASGNTRTVSVAIRKCVIADGTPYNGDQPRLMLKQDTTLGISSNTVIATATNAANGAFEVISGTTPAATSDGVFEFYVDCNNAAQTSTKFINIDDFMVIS